MTTLTIYPGKSYHVVVQALLEPIRVYTSGTWLRTLDSNDTYVFPGEDWCTLSFRGAIKRVVLIPHSDGSYPLFVCPDLVREYVYVG